MSSMNVAYLRTAISSRRAKLVKLGRTFQPLVIYAGTASDIKSVYVVIAQTVYKVNALLQVVDVELKGWGPFFAVAENVI